MSQPEQAEFFPNIFKVEYKGPRSTDPLSFRHYNADEIILDKPMKEWLRFSVCWWHTFAGGAGRDPFGAPTLFRPWDINDTMDPIEQAKRRIDVAFEFFTKLGVQYYTFHDFDVTPPESSTLEESLRNMDVIADYLLEKQHDTGVQLLWATQNLFSHPRYMNGALTNPDLAVFCTAAAQIQKVADVIAKLGGHNHVFWGGREGYQTLLNTNVKQECDHMAAMLHMAADYNRRQGYTTQLLLEPKPREPCKHQYDYDAQTTYCFLQHYGLATHFKLNIEPNHTTLAGHAPEHDITMAASFDMLGSIDANTGDTLLGWDTDQFPMDLRETTAIMSVVVQQGGLAPGGLNFDAKVRRESVDPEDLFVAHIAAMDCYALGLRKAVAMQSTLQGMVDKRYASWSTHTLGLKIETGSATLEECAAFAKQQEQSDGSPPPLQSAKQELFEAVRNRFLYG